MDRSLDTWLVTLAVGGLAVGLWLLARGMAGYRTAARIADTSTSRISSAAAGEVRISGTIEPAEVLLVSVLQGKPCVYYRSTIKEGDESSTRSFQEERSVGFAVRDDSGSLRVFPRGARIDAPARFKESTGALGDEPPGLSVRVGDTYVAANPSRDTAVADLLRVKVPDPSSLSRVLGGGRGHREYEEARLEPGDVVTLIGRAMPFRELDDPSGADLGSDGDAFDPGGDPEIAADIAAARAAGTLLTDPDDAWGNAAIPGFGIGRPIRAPELDPAAHPLPLGTADDVAAAERTFTIDPGALVVAASAEVPLLIAYGAPGVAVGRADGQFLLGLIGAAVAIASAMIGAIVIGGGSRP